MVSKVWLGYESASISNSHQLVEKIFTPKHILILESLYVLSLEKLLKFSFDAQNLYSVSNTKLFKKSPKVT